MDETNEQADDEKTDNCVYLPTPEEIAAECARIRAEWDADRLRKSKTR